MFTPEQEEWLGAIMDRDIRREYNVIEDPEGYLQKLGEKILAQLPPIGIHFQFVIIDSPELNAFGSTGGRIYINRRIIAFAKNEDELASLVGHEIGHMFDHHLALDMTDYFKQLEIGGVGDQKDLEGKWNRFKDNQRKVKSHGGEKALDEEQLLADRISLYAMTRAGYNTNSMIEFDDRLYQTKGKTGGFWSDFFGMTDTDSKRLREEIKYAEPIARGCIAPRTADNEHFSRWQKSIIEAKVAARAEDLPGLVRKIRLQPNLRDDLWNLRFSPDGKYLLAQDDSSIFVLTREQPSFVFRIDTLDAHSAQFSADSRSVVFYDKELRVETWDIATKQRNDLRQFTVPDCFQTVLSPSGRYLACVTPRMSLHIEDIQSNKIVFRKEKIYDLSEWDYYRLVDALNSGDSLWLFDLTFSPDDRYFVLGHSSTTLAYDLQAGAEVHIPGKMAYFLRSTFAFVSPDEIAGIDTGAQPPKLVRARFPSGDKIDDFQLNAYGRLFSTQNPNYLLLRPAGTYPVGILSLKSRKIEQAFKTPAFAIYGETFAGEQNSGEIGLMDSTTKKLISKIQLPDSPLSDRRVAAFSENGKWAAVSGKSRGAMWKLEDGERVFFTHGFEGAVFDQDQMVSRLTAHDAVVPQVYRFDLAGKQPKKLYDDIDDAEHMNHKSWQVKNLVISVRPEKDSDKEKRSAFWYRLVMEARDLLTNKPLWQRKMYEGQNRFSYIGDAVLLQISGWPGIRAAAKDDPALDARLKTVDDRHEALVLQAVEPTDGKYLGSVLIDTGKNSFTITNYLSIGDAVFVADSEERTLIYSLKSGMQKGKLPGRMIAVNSSGSRVLVMPREGIADLFDAASLQPLAHFSFPTGIIHAEFLPDGTMQVMTADQTVYQLKPDETRQSASVQ